MIKEIDGYTVKNIYNDNDLSDEELEEKISLCDAYIPVFGTTNVNEALKAIKEQAPQYHPLWIHIHHRDNMVTIGGKLK